MTELDPKTLELVQTGATATLILDAVTLFANECVELCLKRIDTEVREQEMTPDVALGLVSEIAAYRRIVQRIKTKAQQGTTVRIHDGRTAPPAA